MPVPSLPTLTVARTPDKTATALVVGYGAAGATYLLGLLLGTGTV